MIRDQRRRLLSIFAAIALVALVLPADRAAAAPIPSEGASTQSDAAGVAAERAALQAQLTGLGLTESEAEERVALLTDEEVHAIAADPDMLRVVAGNEAGVALVVLIVVLVVGLSIFAHHMPHYR